MNSQDNATATIDLPSTVEKATNTSPPKPEDSQVLDNLLDRINSITSAQTPGLAKSMASDMNAKARTTAPSGIASGHSNLRGNQQVENQQVIEEWFPVEPASLAKAGVTSSEVETFILKYLNARAEASGREISEQIKIPFRIVDPMMQSLKDDHMVAHKGAGLMNDYVYQLTIEGREKAKKLADHCSYYGSVPVPLHTYVDSVKRQTIATQKPTEDDLQRAFADLLIDKDMLRRLGPAINSGLGLFLFGAPGNGKTSIAERVTKSFGEFIWIPRSIGIDGEIMRLYDPSMHEEAPVEASNGLIEERRYDPRWVRIKRPTIVVGGELTMEALEVTYNPTTNVSEAPVQLKSNCGTLVIDDFGRQRMTTDELLNRWIVPLEKRYDFLNLVSGKKLQVPFDQLIVFSTNLEPKDLVDDAFLRRIPYKIEVKDPDEASFRKLLQIMAKSLEIAYDSEAADYLVKQHYLAVNRPFRCCQPRDLMLQIRNYCRYVRKPQVMSKENVDFAVDNYFAIM